MARAPDRGREENAPTVLTRRSSVWSLWSVFVYLVWHQTDQRDGRQRDRPKYRFTGVESARSAISSVRDGRGGRRAIFEERLPSLPFSSSETIGSNKTIAMPDGESIRLVAGT